MAKEIIVIKFLTINQPSQVVYNYLKITRNQENFSVWNMNDPAKETSSSGIDGTEGFTYSWNSKIKNVGAGSQTITKLVDGQSIEYALQFEKPMKNTGTSKFLIETISENQTKVIWEFRGPTKFPMSLFTGAIQKMLGKDITKSLENLKSRLEQ